MFSLFSNKKKEVRSIIIDIQSGLVRGALVVDKPNEPSTITCVVTKSISGKSQILNSEHLVKKMLKLIAEVAEHLARDNGRNTISYVSYTLSDPWINSKLKTVRINYEKETEITTDILENIIKEELKNNSAVADIRPVEQKIFEVRLNGYPAVMFQGKKAHTLEVSLSTSFGSSQFLDKVHDTINKYIHVKKHSIHSALLMQYIAMQEVLKNKNEYLYIHVHSELTDLIAVKDGLCKHIISFPFGIKTVLRKVANGSNESVETSDSLISLFQGDKLSEQEKENMQRIITPLVHEWSDLCIKSFEGVLDITSIPRTVYLSAHSHFDLFKEALIFQNKLNFDVIAYDSISIGNQIKFGKGVEVSNMMRIYTFALRKDRV